MIKRIIIILVFTIIFIIGTLLIVMSSGVSDTVNIDEYLTKNGFQLIDQDTSEYIKEESTLDDFYYNKESFTDATYVAYYFSIELKTFKEVKMSYTDETKTTLMYTISNKLNTDIITINYEISNDSKTYNVSGAYDISEDKFDCEGIDNEESKDTYCDNALNKIKDYIPKRKKLLDNKDIMKAIETTQNEVVID